MATRARLGFTLIELLVVVAIIALLISLLLPALNGARRQSKQVLCLTNMRSFGAAARLYAQENKDVLVQGDNRDPGGNTTTHFVGSLLPGLGYPENVNKLFRRTPGQTFTEALYRVCKVVKQLQCPEFPKPEQVLDYVVNAFELPVRGRPPISSITGPGPIGAGPGDRPAEFFHYAKAGRAITSELVYLTEAHQEMPLPTPEGQPWDPSLYWSELTDLFTPDHMALAGEPRVANDQRHPVGLTAAFFDGHAEVNPVRWFDRGPPANVFDRLRRFTYSEREWRP